MDDDVASRMSALGHPVRLAAASELARRPQGIPASRLATHLGVKRPLMTAHLKVLAAAGLVTSERAGKEIIYKGSRSTYEDLVAALRTALLTD